MNEIALPKEIKKSDLKGWPGRCRGPVDSFNMWYNERFGWCIPTLLISRATWRRKNTENIQDRTYGISLGGQIVTMGGGPHIKRTVTVYVFPANRKRLQKFLDLREKGKGDAGQIRDRISTRRAQTSLRRMAYGW